MKIYVHYEDQPEAEAAEVAPDSVLRELVPKANGEPFVLLEDSEEELDLERTFAELGIAEGAHVFVGQLHRIDVEVLFNGEPRAERFSASTRVSRVFKWAVARKAFDFSEADAAEHTLVLANDVAPPGDTHLGSLDDATPGRVAFRLIPRHRYEG